MSVPSDPSKAGQSDNVASTSTQTITHPHIHHAAFPTTMAGPNDPNKAGRNHNGDHFPHHCVLQNRPDFPNIAVPYESKEKEGFENALLVTSNTMQDLIETLVNGSARLKAWFALKLPHVGPNGETAKKSIAPQWGPVWAMIQKQKSSWNSRYDPKDQSGMHWEVSTPSSVGELYAIAMFVLYRKTRHNREANERRMTRLKWHAYYDDDKKKFFLLYNFLAFLDFYCTGPGAIQFDRPTKDEKLPTWNNSRGSRMHSAVRQFQTSEYTFASRCYLRRVTD
jgi:hypothetical protein